MKPNWLTINLGALDTEADDKTLIPGELTRCENYQLQKVVPLVKRFGTSRLSRTIAGPTYSAISGAIGVGLRNDRTDLIQLSTDDRVYSYEPTTDSWVDRGDWPMMHVSEDAVQRTGYEQYDGTTAATGSARFNVWTDVRGVWAQAYRIDGGTYGQAFQIAGGNARCPRAFAADGSVTVLYISGSNPDLYSANLNATDPTAAASTIVTRLIVPSVDASVTAYDVSPLPTHDGALMAAHLQGNQLYVAFMNSNGGLGTQTTTPSRPNPYQGALTFDAGPSICVADDSVKCAVSFHESSSPGSCAVRTIIFDLTSATIGGGLSAATDSDPSLAVTGSVRRISSVFGQETGSNYKIHVTTEVSASDRSDRRLRYGLRQLAVDSTSGSLKRHCSLGSTAFRLGTRPWVWGTHLSDQQSSDFLVRLDDGWEAGPFRYGRSLADVSGVLGNAEVIGDSVHRLSTNRETLELPIAQTSGTAFQDRDVRLMTVDYHPSSSWQPVDVDRTLHMPGPMHGNYDGSSVTEQGFMLRTEGTAVTPCTTAGNLAAGSYLWAVVPEAFDSNGKRYLGAYASFATASLIGANNSGTLDIRTISHTLRDGTRAPSFKFRVYRNALPDDTILQFVGSVVNDTTVDRIRFNDNVPASVAANGEIVPYADGGGPEDQNDITCAGPRTMALSSDRLFLAGMPDSRLGIRASKLVLGGAVAMLTDDVMNVESRGGPITALANLDDRLIVAKADSLHTHDEGFPASNSAQDTSPWPVLHRQVSDVGMPEPPVVGEAAGTTVQGLVFRSRRGMRLLGRNLSVSDIGGPVRGLDPLSAVALVPASAHEEIRVMTVEGTTMVLNTRFNRWTTFPGQPSVGAADWSQGSTYISPDGHAFVEDTGSYRDAGSSYSSLAEFGWIDFGDQVGYGRFRGVEVQLNLHSPCRLRVEMAYDYRDIYRVVREVDLTGALGFNPYGGGTSGSVGSFGYGSGSYGGGDADATFWTSSPQERCEAFRLRLSDVSQSGDSRGFDIVKIKALVMAESKRTPLGTKKLR